MSTHAPGRSASHPRRAAAAPPACEPHEAYAGEQAVIVTDADGTIRAWNPVAEALYGWSADEVLGRSIVEVTPSTLSRERAAAIMERLARGQSWAGDFEVRRRDGTVFLAHVTDTPLFDERGRLTGVVGASYDVTRRRAVEDALRRENEELEDFFENASIGMHWVGPDGTILRANRVEMEMLGYAPDEYLGRHIAEFHVDPEAISDILRRLAAGEALVEYPARLRRRDGSVAHVRIDSSVRFRDGEFVHTRCLTRDVTERLRDEEEMRRLKDEAEAASRAKSEFLAVMSHELRTPLNAIIGYRELLSMEVAGPLTERQRHHLGRIGASAGYLLELIDQILTLSRIEAGREEVMLEPVDAAALADDVASLLRPVAQRKGLAMETLVDNGAGSIDTDRAKLRQILLNLLANAVKFTDRGGVSLRVARENGVLRFAVRDTGPGIAPEHRETIFVPFTQLNQGPTRREGGTGLGLTVSRRLAALLGGDIAVDSEVGAGSTFAVTLPLAPAPE
jgi:PAS domain S-box-containing protein